jgi:hypothetical protein
MSPRRLALLALLAIALAPASARAGIPVGMYPFRVPGLSAQQRTELHTLLEAGLVSAARRGILQPRAPVLQLATCGETPAPACLGGAAKEGLLLVGRGEIKGSVLLVTAALYDRNGNRTREARFVVDLVIQNLRPIGEALVELEIEIDPDGTVAGSKKGLPPERDPFGQKPAVAGAPPRAPAAPAPLPARPAPAEPVRAKIDVSAPAAPAVWKRQAGPLFTIVGGALLAGGAVVAIQARNLAEDLNSKHAAGTLRAVDRPTYDKVDRYNVLSAVLLSAGGVSAAAGTWIWITAPARPGGGAVAMAGGTF